MPILNVEPGLWVDVRICEPELSDAVGSVQETLAVGIPLSVFDVILVGIPVMTGFSLSVWGNYHRKKKTYGKALANKHTLNWDSEKIQDLSNNWTPGLSSSGLYHLFLYSHAYRPSSNISKIRNY